MDTDSSKNNISSTNMTVAEISVDVPWGQIVGKAWGSPSGRPVLSLHGWLDNAGSFDKLIPLLSPDLYVVAIDAPGHGLSSPRPAGSHYQMINYVAEIKYVVDALGWKRFSFLAHSIIIPHYKGDVIVLTQEITEITIPLLLRLPPLAVSMTGAAVATLFAASLPEYVEKMVALDGLLPISAAAEEMPAVMGDSIKRLDDFKDKAVKIYPSIDACVARLMERNEHLTQESAEILAVRGTAPVENGYVFTRDQRLQLTLVYLSLETIISFIKALQCRVLLISYKDSVVPTEKMDTVIQHFKMSKGVVIPGSHHVHLNNAPSVAPFINEWL